MAVRWLLTHCSSIAYSCALRVVHIIAELDRRYVRPYQSDSQIYNQSVVCAFNVNDRAILSTCQWPLLVVVLLSVSILWRGTDQHGGLSRRPMKHVIVRR